MGQGSDPSADTPRVTPEIAAEAAMWVARLHGPSRSREMELQCLQWQGQSAAHRHAFERSTDIWMEVPSAALASGYVPGDPDRLSTGDKWGGRGLAKRGLLVMGAGAAVALVAGALAWRTADEAGVYRTAIGESQTVVLADGTRLSLNTDTRVRVDLGSQQRTVSVTTGEAAFEVAKDAVRPFVVRAGGTEVVALGTVFSVRHVPQGPAGRAQLAVTLVEGRVAVRAAADAGAGSVVPARTVEMNAGERVRLVRDSAATAVVQVDRPRMEQVLAWQRNEAVFDKVTLAEAVAEMNRYSRTPVVLAAELLVPDLQVSGQFRTGDNLAFARALAMLHGLSVREREGRVELSRGP